jgi:hypothetical protein
MMEMKLDLFCNVLIHVRQCSELPDVALSQCSNQEILGLVEQHMQESPVTLGFKSAVDQDHNEIWEVSATLSYDANQESFDSY